MSAYWKIPLQVLVLVLGILVFVFYVFNPPPLLFSTVHAERLQRGRRRRRTRRSSRSSTARSRRAATAAAGARRGTRRRTTRPAWPRREDGRPRNARRRVQSVRGKAARLVRETTGDRRLYRRQLHHSDVHPHAAAGRPDRPADRRHHHGRDRHDRRRAQLAVHRNGHRLLPAAAAPERLGRALPDASRRSRRACGDSSPARSPSGRRSSDR